MNEKNLKRISPQVFHCNLKTNANNDECVVRYFVPLNFNYMTNCTIELSNGPVFAYD
jgi:hypothetical protein